MSNEINIFEEACRTKLRFETSRGLITAEDLWDLPLQSNNGFDLDNIARHTNQALKDLSVESFVSTNRSNPNKQHYELAMALVLRVIEVKLEARDSARKAKAKAEEKARLLEILERKNSQELEGLSKDDIIKRIEELN